MVACYVELGKLDDARAELTKVLKARPILTDKTLRHFLPFKDDIFFDQFRSALVEAGLPE